MRQNTFSDMESRALLNNLKLEKFGILQDKSDPEFQRIVKEIHGKFHYEVAKWLSEIGAPNF